MDQIINNLQQFWEYTGFANATFQHILMICIGIGFLAMGIIKEWEPLLLVPIGFGIIIGNIPLYPGFSVGIYEEGSVLNILYHGVKNGWYPPLIFLGIGAMTDFSSLISNPKLLLIGAAAQLGIFAAYSASLLLGFEANAAGAIGIIGGADGPTAIFLSSRLAPDLLGAIAVSAYSYMALVPLIQPHHALVNNKKGTAHTDEISPRSDKDGENHFPGCWFIADRFYRSFGFTSSGNALFREHSERKRCYQEACRNSPRPPD